MREEVGRIATLGISMDGGLVAVQLTRHRADQSHRKLMLAVLEDGLKGYLGHGLKHSEDKEWLFSDDIDHPFSFVVICEEFGLRPEAVREALVRQREALQKWQVRRTTPGGQQRLSLKRRSVTAITTR